MRELLRQELDDEAAPYLWSDIELNAFLVDAENEACRRARLLVDSSTAAVCQISITAGDVTAGTASYSLDSRVVSVRRAKTSERTKPLARTTRLEMDEMRSGWDDDVGSIEAFLTEDTGKILFWRIPDVTQTISMTVVRTPLVEMNDDEDSPEIPSRYHYSLLYWAKYRAYMKQDTETKDENKALENEALFTAEFGPRRTALDEAFEMQHGYDPVHGAF